VTQRDTTTRRTVVGNISLSLDGRVTGRGGDSDMSWVAQHAISNASREFMVRVTSPATTALLGRKNYQGFGGYWPTVARDENADPRDRSFALWLDSVEKVVFSTTVEDAEWNNTRIVDAAPATEVKRLRMGGGGDIIVLNSVSVINNLLEADELDRLSITLCPEVVGGGARLFEDGLPASSWRLTDMSSTETGAISLLYDRVREAE
jgi:dihydrofolate reductase